MVAEMLKVTREIHCLRDATRGGLSAVLNELAVASNVGIEFEEGKVPVRPAVNAACEMLGLDPFYIANEGKLVAFVPKAQAEEVLAVMRNNEYGKEAALIGHVTEEHPGLVVAKTAIGSSRVVDLPAGELLPRIC
jgi:hydrogenase expression/formation protein HypE